MARKCFTCKEKDATKVAVNHISGKSFAFCGEHAPAPSRWCSVYRIEEYTLPITLEG